MPLTALGTKIELWAADAGSATWDNEIWDTGTWGTPAWQDVTPESLSGAVSWGTDRVVGVLSVASAGRIALTTYDPLRVLDPANQASPYWYALRPGTPFRVSYNGLVIRTGFLDSVTYAQAGDTGRVEGSDGIALMAQARVLVSEMAGAPTSLHALARYLVALKSLPLTVEGDPAGVNVVDHPGAEGFPDAYATTPPGWSTSGSGTIGTSSGRTHSGTRAYNIRGVVTATNSGVLTSQQVNPGGTYKLGVWRNREGYADGVLTVYLHFWAAADGAYIGSSLGLGGLILTWPAGVNDPDTWTYKEVTAAVPAGAGYIAVALDYNGGSDWVDDISVTLALPTYPVSAAPTSDTTVWDWLVLAAADTLTAVWVDPLGVIRFRPYGAPRDLGLTVGGSDGIPVTDLEVSVSADGVWNRATCARPGGGAVANASDAESVRRFGERLVARTRPAPDPDGWVANVVLDRAFATLNWSPRTLRVRDATDLADLVAAGMVDMVRVKVDSAVPPVSTLARVLGGSFAVTWADGWSAQVTAYVPSTDWRADQTPPAPPINPSPPPTQRVVRQYACTADARVALTSGGGKYGAGTAAQIPVGSWQGWQNRGLFRFASIPWGDVVAVVSARVLFTTSSQVNIGFGSSPKSTVRRITANWSEGSLASPGSGNSVVWPGPATSSSGAVTEGVSGTQGARVDFDATAIARAWAPGSAGGSNQPNYGVAMYSAGESSDKYTTEFLARETGSSGSRPVLELTLDVLA